MTGLRAKKKGGQQKPWTQEEILAGFEHFYNEYGRYPTANEVDYYTYLPSARTIERNFGGLVSFRKEIKQDGQDDYRKGEHSSKRASTINKRSNTTEFEIYNILIKQFGKEFVHREYLFSYDARTRADFFVYTMNGNFCVDVFYPSDIRNLMGCVNSKIKKYRKPDTLDYPVIFLNLNDTIDPARIRSYITSRKTPIPRNHSIMGKEEFKQFCSSKKRRKLQ